VPHKYRTLQALYPTIRMRLFFYSVGLLIQTPPSPYTGSKVSFRIKKSYHSPMAGAAAGAPPGRFRQCERGDIPTTAIKKVCMMAGYLRIKPTRVRTSTPETVLLLALDVVCTRIKTTLLVVYLGYAIHRATHHYLLMLFPEYWYPRLNLLVGK